MLLGNVIKTVLYAVASLRIGQEDGLMAFFCVEGNDVISFSYF